MMKYLVYPLFLSVISACGNAQEEKAVPEQINTNSHKCNLDEFVSHTKVSKLAKKIYFDEDWDLTDDKEAMKLLDSLNAKSQAARLFYFKVLTKSYEKADGYFSEGLGLAGKEYIESKPAEFSSYFDKKDCFKDKDLETWAKIVVMEMSIGEEGQDFDMKMIDEYTGKLKAGCKNCTESQKETLRKFEQYLRIEWNDFLKKVYE